MDVLPCRSLPERVVKAVRPQVKSKFVFIGDEKFYIRGVTYGPFRPDADGCEYHTPEVVGRDFSQIAAAGVNAVRTYTVPPEWLLHLAQAHGLRVLVGIPWEQHIAFLDDPQRPRNILARVAAGVRACRQHPAILCYVIGNEIPAPIVRWYGRGRIERFLEKLYRAAKAEHPDGLFTYVNYPSTEYLQLPFLDLVAFNVYLESRDRLEAYLARLHNLSGDRPLILGEIGIDSLRNGEAVQAEVLDWQVRTAFASGCAGAFVFAWTDEWHRGGYDIEDWNFGLTTRDRRPKAALASVTKAFSEIPFPPHQKWPRISVVVCTYNGNRTIGECFEGLSRLQYPDYEVIVVDDGSTDATTATAREWGYRLITTPNRGLSAARNTGLQASTGEIIAYIDDDAYPDPHWLTYLAATFTTTNYAGVGGPNIPPPDDGPIADCVANAPGGPIHVLLSDREAEHIPGCNMAFRKSCLEAIGGFDPQFRTAGDDVDVCWRLQERGWALGFSPAAVVWHRRRNAVRGYWKQQKGYGKAEALLERKWPQKYNAIGHLTWTGRVYGRGLPDVFGRLGRIYRGTWGCAPFQSIYRPADDSFWSILQMPEWYLVILALAGLCGLGLSWKPLLWLIPVFLLAAGAPLVQAIVAGLRAHFISAPASGWGRLRLQGLTALLHLLQPLARLTGRLHWGLTPWRRRGAGGFAFPRPCTFTTWSEAWHPPEHRLRLLEATLKFQGAVVLRGGDFDRWDLSVRGGLLGDVRLQMAVEEHGGGNQFVRLQCWAESSTAALAPSVAAWILAVGAVSDRAWTACVVLGLGGALLWLRSLMECAAAMGEVLLAIGARTEKTQDKPPEHDMVAPVLPLPASLASRLRPAVEARSCQGEDVVGEVVSG